MLTHTLSLQTLTSLNLESNSISNEGARSFRSVVKKIQVTPALIFSTISKKRSPIEGDHHAESSMERY